VAAARAHLPSRSGLLQHLTLRPGFATATMVLVQDRPMQSAANDATRPRSKSVWVMEYWAAARRTAIRRSNTAEPALRFEGTRREPGRNTRAAKAELVTVGSRRDEGVRRTSRDAHGALCGEEVGPRCGPARWPLRWPLAPTSSAIVGTRSGGSRARQRELRQNVGLRDWRGVLSRRAP
jgi:hypothetical protein